MKHPDEGTMRRMVDEPTLVRETDRRHVEDCARCRNAMREIQVDAEAAARSMQTMPAPLDTRAALSAVRARIATGQIPARRPWYARSLEALRFKRVAAGAGTAGVLAGALLLTPAGSWAQSFITIFQPSQIQPVSVTTDQLLALPKLRSFGTVHLPRRAPMQTFSSVDGAQAAAGGMHVVVPAHLPSDIPSTVQYQVMPGMTGSFTFDAQKAARALTVQGQRLPAMPAHLNGSTLQVAINSTVAAIYGSSKDLPSLVVGEMRAPKVTSTGASVAEVENYLLKMPGISPQLAAELRGIQNPASTLPLIIPVDQAQAHEVQINGTQGWVIGDNTGVGSAVVWEKAGIIYGVGGTLPESEALTIAESLS